MKTVRFIDGGRWGYRCTLPGDQSGEYVRAETARALFASLVEMVGICPDCDGAGYDRHEDDHGEELLLVCGTCKSAREALEAAGWEGSPL